MEFKKISHCIFYSLFNPSIARFSISFIVNIWHLDNFGLQSPTNFVHVISVVEKRISFCLSLNSFLYISMGGSNI